MAAFRRYVGLSAADAVEVLLEPGDLALSNPYLVHGSGKNRSDHMRRLYINGYVRAADCDRGEWAFRGGEAAAFGPTPALVHYDELQERPEPHYSYSKHLPDGAVRIRRSRLYPDGTGRMRLSDFEALSFDCYGTLIDWETGILNALRRLRERTRVPDEELLETYGIVEFEIEQEHPTLLYSQLLEKVYSGLCERFGVDEDEIEAAKFGASVGDWPPFSDSVEALRYLKEHFQLVILSNVDRLSFAGSNRQLGVEFDYIFTAEDIGSYKPDLRNFEYLVAKLGENGIGKDRLLHTAQSLFHDHAPANRMGIASAWIDRRHNKIGGGATVLPDPMPHYDFRFASLGELADAHRAEQG